MRKTVVIVADDHSGHPFALPPTADGWEKADGNFEGNNEWQDLLWKHWISYWRRVGDLRMDGPLIVVHAGDAVEGSHHGIVQLITSRIDEQERMHISSMRTGLQLAGFDARRDTLIYLSGSEAHTGVGNASTERIMRALLDVEKLDGACIRYRLYATVNGVLFDVAHHGYRLGSREWTRTNAMRAYLSSTWTSCLKRKRQMPRYVVRAHRHTYGHASLEDDDGNIVSEAFLMPAWKLRDDHVASFAPEAIASIGLLAFTVDEDSRSQKYPMVMSLDPDSTGGIEEL